MYPHTYTMLYTTHLDIKCRLNVLFEIAVDKDRETILSQVFLHQTLSLSGSTSSRYRTAYHFRRRREATPGVKSVFSAFHIHIQLPENEKKERNY